MLSYIVLRATANHRKFVGEIGKCLEQPFYLIILSEVRNRTVGLTDFLVQLGI